MLLVIGQNHLHTLDDGSEVYTGNQKLFLALTNSFFGEKRLPAQKSVLQKIRAIQYVQHARLKLWHT